MRAERFASAEPERASIGPLTLIMAAIGCFTVGFLVLMAVPRIWPRYIQTAAVADPQPVKILEVGTTAPPPPQPISAPVPGVVTDIKTSAAPTPQKIAAYGSLANLAECKAAIRAGETYQKIGPDQMAAMFGTRGKPLTSAQLDAGCRKLTE